MNSPVAEPARTELPTVPLATAAAPTPCPAGNPGHGIDYGLFLDCIHCGLCLAACPTYEELSTEMDGPRGRIYLMRAVTDGRLAPDAAVRKHLDLCLDCRACESACPSGVQYGRIAETAREHIGPPGAKSTRTILNFFFKQVLPRPSRLKAIARLMRIYQTSGLPPLVRKLLPQRVRDLEAMMPAIPRKFFDPAIKVWSAIGERRAKVAMLNGCIMPLLFGEVNQATVRVLQHNGCEVVIPENQTCCGALNTHNGESAAARQMARQNIDSFFASGAETLIVNAAGCGAATCPPCRSRPARTRRRLRTRPCPSSCCRPRLTGRYRTQSSDRRRCP